MRADATEATRARVQRHWALANAREWDAFGALLDPALRYEVPQTREYIDGGPGYLEMFRTWPGAWTAVIRELVCDGERAVCIVDFAVDGQTMTGISVFVFRDGRIAAVTDYWPEPYEPPPRATAAMKRHPA